MQGNQLENNSSNQFWKHKALKLILNSWQVIEFKLAAKESRIQSSPLNIIQNNSGGKIQRHLYYTY
jgi:hypothetical protein